MFPCLILFTLIIPAEVLKGIFLKTATQSSVVEKLGCIVSQTFFFGFNCSSGSPVNPSKITLSPGTLPEGGIKKFYLCVA